VKSKTTFGKKSPKIEGRKFDFHLIRALGTKSAGDKLLERKKSAFFCINEISDSFSNNGATAQSRS